MQERTTTLDIYAYPEPAWSTLDLSGYDVEATDGGIGKVDDRSTEIGSGVFVVDTGPWIFGKKVMLPAGVIGRIDTDRRRIWVSLTKDAIENAPEVDESKLRDTQYRDEVGAYYAGRIGRDEAMTRPSGPDYGARDRS